MAELSGIYKCGQCGNIAQVLHAEQPPVMCCGQPMDRLVENTVDAALEKHVPVIEKNGDTYIVKVGSVDHPMENEHWIEWIELASEDNTFVQRKVLNPTDKPCAEFKTDIAKVVARAYCNLHGFWHS